jgi:pimeloyl-ACP methyl ester carboxylesterase
VSTYLLSHGAWQGAWCWRKVIPLLEANGHTVLAPDLPGHGDDTTPPCDGHPEELCRRYLPNRQCSI